MKLDASDITDLQPLIAAAVESTLKAIGQRERQFGDRIGYTEPEAAALLGVPSHVLGDARRREEITATRVGKRWIYSRQTLLDFLK